MGEGSPKSWDLSIPREGLLTGDYSLATLFMPVLTEKGFSAKVGGTGPVR